MAAMPQKPASNPALFALTPPSAITGLSVSRAINRARAGVSGLAFGWVAVAKTGDSKKTSACGTP